MQSYLYNDIEDGFELECGSCEDYEGIVVEFPFDLF